MFFNGCYHIFIYKNFQATAQVSVFWQLHKLYTSSNVPELMSLAKITVSDALTRASVKPVSSIVKSPSFLILMAIKPVAISEPQSEIANSRQAVALRPLKTKINPPFSLYS